ncbi:MAG: IS1 family transposase [Bacteroidia bacterium]
MNKLPIEKRTQIINCLVEGMSLRATSRLSGCSINTVTKLLVDVGKACQKFHNETVKNIASKRVQCDEIWSFVYAKAKNVPEEKQGEAGDVWTWVGMDSDSKLVISWFIGNRDAESAHELMEDLATRLTKRVQLTTDGLKAYLDAVEDAFPSGIDFAQLVKLYGNTTREEARKYSPAECIGATKTPIMGAPDPDHISTSHIERQNLTMRMHMRRFTRLTNAFSKKVENHCYAIALHFVYYNFCKAHKSLNKATPAMAAGLTDWFMEISDIVKLADKENSN